MSLNEWLDEATELINKNNVICENVSVDTSEYELAHGKKPRGKGTWGFIYPEGITESDVAIYNESGRTIDATKMEDGRLLVFFRPITTYAKTRDLALDIAKKLKIDNIVVGT